MKLLVSLEVIELKIFGSSDRKQSEDLRRRFNHTVTQYRRTSLI